MVIVLYKFYKIKLLEREIHSFSLKLFSSWQNVLLESAQKIPSRRILSHAIKQIHAINFANAQAEAKLARILPNQLRKMTCARREARIFEIITLHLGVPRFYAFYAYFFFGIEINLIKFKVVFLKCKNPNTSTKILTKSFGGKFGKKILALAISIRAML